MKLTGPDGKTLLEVHMKGTKWKATFQGNESCYEDPWTTALVIEERFPIESWDLLKEVKLTGWWKNKMPISVLIWFLSGGEEFWTKTSVKWNSQKADEWWRSRLEESMIGAENLRDIVIALRWFKNDDILRSNPESSISF